MPTDPKKLTPIFVLLFMAILVIIGTAFYLGQLHTKEVAKMPEATVIPEMTLSPSAIDATPISSDQATASAHPSPSTMPPAGIVLQQFQFVQFTANLGSFYDQNFNARALDYSAIINWGDGLSQQGDSSIMAVSPGFAVFGTHTYQSAGQFPVTITVRSLVGKPKIVVIKSVIIVS